MITDREIEKEEAARQFNAARDRLNEHVKAKKLTEALGASAPPKRHPVDFLYHLLNWNFIRDMARNAKYANDKYGSVEQYTDGDLTGEKSPMNHIQEHFRQYMCGEAHDKFASPAFHLVAIAYNAMMEYWYFHKRGRIRTPVNVPGDGRRWDCYTPLRSHFTPLTNAAQDTSGAKIVGRVFTPEEKQKLAGYSQNITDAEINRIIGSGRRAVLEVQGQNLYVVHPDQRDEVMREMLTADRSPSEEDLKFRSIHDQIEKGASRVR